MALEHRGLHVIALGELAVEREPLATGQELGAFLLADIDIRKNLLQLIVGGLRADHGRELERIALLDLFHPGNRLLHEAVVDRALHQCA